MHTLYINNLVTVSSTSFEHPRVHLQEDLHMQFYGFMTLYQAHPAIDQTAYMEA